MAEHTTFNELLAQRYAARDRKLNAPRIVLPTAAENEALRLAEERRIEALAAPLEAARRERLAAFAVACTHVAGTLRGADATAEVVLVGSVKLTNILHFTSKHSVVHATGWTLTDEAVIGWPESRHEEQEPMGLERSGTRYYRTVTTPGRDSRRWGVILDESGLAVRYDGEPGAVSVKKQSDGTVQKTVEIWHPTVEVLDARTSFDVASLMPRLADVAFAHDVQPHTHVS